MHVHYRIAISQCVTPLKEISMTIVFLVIGFAKNMFAVHVPDRADETEVAQAVKHRNKARDGCFTVRLALKSCKMGDPAPGIFLHIMPCLSFSHKILDTFPRLCL